METILYKRKGDKVVAIVKAYDWFKAWYDENKMPLIIPKDRFIVGEYNDYDDGKIDGGSTIAICTEFSDAELIFNNKKI
jgi:hypothetical protein